MNVQLLWTALILFSITILIKGCKEEWKGLMGNAYCDDFLNNANCNFDGGDCCNPNANTDYCFHCTCFEDSNCPTHLLTLVGNGYCNDETNIAGCNYDGGDCCGSCVNMETCSECICYVAAASRPSLACKFFKHKESTYSKKKI